MMKFKSIHGFILAAALAQGVMWVNVFSLIHNGLWSYIGGIPAGLAIVGLVVYAANALPRVQSLRARKGGWALLVLVMVVEPIVLGVVNWWSMPENFRMLPVSYPVAGGASLVITLALVLGSLLDRSLLPAEKQKKARPKAKVVAMPVFSCANCVFIAKSQKALNAHQRKHKP